MNDSIYDTRPRIRELAARVRDTQPARGYSDDVWHWDVGNVRVTCAAPEGVVGSVVVFLWGEGNLSNNVHLWDAEWNLLSDSAQHSISSMTSVEDDEIISKMKF